MSVVLRRMVYSYNFAQIAQKKLATSNPRFLKLLFIFSLFFMAGCQEKELLANLDSSDSIKILSVLSDVGITAERQSSSQSALGTYRILVASDDYRNALKVVSEVNFLKSEDIIVGKIINPTGFSPSSPEIVAYRLDYLLAREIEGLLLNVKGILSAAVTVNLHQLKNNESSLEQKPSVTAVINYLNNDSNKIEKPGIENLIKSSISDPKDLKIFVTLTPIVLLKPSADFKSSISTANMLGKYSNIFMLVFAIVALLSTGFLLLNSKVFVFKKQKKIFSTTDELSRVSEESFFDKKE